MYSNSTGTSVDATLDTRLLSLKGLNDIKNDFYTASAITNAIEQIVSNDKVGITDFFKETGKNVKVYDAMKVKISNDEKLSEQLQDPNLNPIVKENMLKEVTLTVMKELGYVSNDVKLVYTDEVGVNNTQVKGYFDDKTNTSYVNDKYNNSTTQLIASLGHEITHDMDKQDNIYVSNDKDQNIYATNFGEDLAFYTNGALNIIKGGNLASTNTHNQGIVTSQASIFNTSNDMLMSNNALFASLDKSGGDDRQVISIRGGNPSKAINSLNGQVDDSEKPFQGQNLEEYQNYYQNKLNTDIQNIKNELLKTNYTNEEKQLILKEEIDRLASSYNVHEFDTSLITLPNAIIKLDAEAKVKIFDSGQKDAIVASILKDYEKGEQIVIQGHSAGGGDAQDVAQDIKNHGITNNVITVQIDSIEPFGNDASIPANVSKAVNVYQSESKTGNKIIDRIDSNAMNGEDEIERDIFNDTTVIINKKFENIIGPATGNVANPHQNIDNDKKVQDFIQKEVLPEVKKDMEKEKNESN